MSIDFDIGAVLRVADKLEGVSAAGLARVKERAVGTLRRRLQAEAARVIPSRFNVAAATVRSRLDVKDDGNTVSLIGSGLPIELHLFGGQYGGRLTPGATAQIQVGGARTVRAGSFIRKNDKQKKIMTRADSKTEIGKRVQRFPIKTEYGPDVGSMLMSSTVYDQLAEFGRTILEDEVARLVAVELKL